MVMAIFSGEALMIPTAQTVSTDSSPLSFLKKNAVIAINAEARDAISMMNCCMDVIVPQL